MRITLRQSGMTLLELMIALTIMSTLMIFSSSSIQQALSSKLKIQTQLDDMSRVRDSLKIIQHDVNLAYHATDLEMEQRDAFKKQFQGAPSNPALPSSFQQAPGATDPTYKETEKDNMRKANRLPPATQFVGTESEMHFATMSSGRVSESQRMADFVKVGYFVDSCSRPGKNRESINTKCLFRRQSNIVEGDVTKGGEAVVLLEDVAEFKLRYKGPSKQDWVSDWASIGGDGGAQGKFPSLVEISLVTEKGSQTQPKRISMQIVAPVRNPNNPPPANNPNAPKTN